jgi:hypothetical protein
VFGETAVAECPVWIVGGDGVVLAPGQQRIEDGDQRVTRLGQLVVVARRRALISNAGKDAGLFE